MNTNLLSIVKQITGEYGEEVLGDARRLKAFFSDLAQDEPKPLRTAFLKCVESGFYRNVKNTESAEERRDVIERLAVRLRDDEGLDLARCTEALETLAAAVFGEGGIAPAAAPKAALAVVRAAPKPTEKPAPKASQSEAVPAAQSQPSPAPKKGRLLSVVLFFFPFAWCFLIFEGLGFKSVDNLPPAGAIIFVIGLFGPWAALLIIGLKKKKEKKQ